MTPAFKPVAVIMMFAFIAPGLWGLPGCVGEAPQANSCKPSCPMMQNMDAGEQVSASSATEHSCCKISSGLPVTDREAFTAEKYASAILSLGIVTIHMVPAPADLFKCPGTAPPTHPSCHQALLCVFLV